MVRVAAKKNNFSKGELDPALFERDDFEPYYQAVKRGTNAVGLPQGGAADRPGLKRVRRLRRVLRRLNLTAGMVTAPNGGVVANLVDDSASALVTTNSVTGATFVVAQVDLGAAQDLAAVDCLQFVCQSLGADDVFAVQTSTDGSTWSALGGLVNIRTAARTRRFAQGGAVISARYVRIVVLTAPAIGTISVQGVRIWTESGRLSRVRRFKMTVDRERTYLLIATDRNLDVYRGGNWVAAVPIPHRSDQLEIVTRAASGDTVLLFHPEVAPRTLFRQGADDEWDSYDQGFTSVPAVTGDTSFASAQVEVQRLDVSGIPAATTFQLLLGEVQSSVLTKLDDPVAMASAIAAALTAMLGAAATVGDVAAAAGLLGFTVRFPGTQVRPALWIDVIGNDAAVVVNSTIQDGRPATGAYMSVTSGWPRCGAFAQTRLLLGGFFIRPETVIGSTVGGYFDFTQTSTPTLVAADVGFDFTLDSDETSIIQHISVGRNIQVFTSNAEWYIPDRALDASQPLNLVQATRHGCRAGVEPQQVDGAALFVQSDGTVVREMLWDDVEQSYRADSISLLSSHLITDVVDIDYRRAAATTEATQIYITNRDGSLAVMTRMRAEKITATFPWVTAGAFRGSGVDAARRVYQIVERTIGGRVDLWLELADSTAVLDAGVRATLGAPTTALTLFPEFDGRDVYVINDGRVYGPLPMTGGVATLPRALSGDIEVGLYYEFVLETLPWRPKDKDGNALRGPRRVHAVDLVLEETTACAIAANGGAEVPVPLRDFPAVLDYRPLAAPFSGEVRVDRLYGRIDGPTVTIRRPHPGRITVRAISLEAS